MARRYTVEDFEPSADELEAAKVVGEGGARATATGNAIGSVAGTALGALGFLVPGAGAAIGPAAMALGSQVGGQLGSMAGSASAEGGLRAAEQTLSDGATKRLKAQEAMRFRQAALQQLINEGR